MNEAMPTLDDALWSMIQPLIPPAKARRTRYPGRKPLGDRAVMAGILYVLETGIPWGQLPQEMGFGSGMSCWRRLRDWQQAGVWAQMHAVLMGQMRSAARVDWSRVQIESRPKRATAEVRAAVIAAAAAESQIGFGVQPAGAACPPPPISALAPAAVLSAQPAPRAAQPQRGAPEAG
jgi:transposase